MYDPAWYVSLHQEIPKNWQSMWSSDVDGGIETVFSPSTEEDPRAIYIDKARWEYLKNMQDNQAAVANDIKDLVSPTRRVGRSIFLDRAGIKLANIDRVFNVTLSKVSYIKQQDMEHLFYVDLAGGPGAFTQYIQYRRPNSRGWGITIKGYPPTEWHLLDTEIMDNRFNIINGERGDGNLILAAEEFVATVNQQTSLPIIGNDINIPGSTRGVDVVVADGWMEPDKTSDAKYKNLTSKHGSGNIYHYAETLNFDLVAIELAVAVQLVRVGGNIVCKVTDTNTERMAQLLYLVSQCFEVFTIFKPISSRPANAEKYVIGLYKRSNIENIIKILVRLQNFISAEHLRLEAKEPIAISLAPSRIISKIDDKFAAWLTTTNNFYLDDQIKYTERIKNYTEAKGITSEDIDLERLYTFWRLPGMYGVDYHPELSKVPITGTRRSFKSEEEKERYKVQESQTRIGGLWRTSGQGRGRGRGRGN